MAAFILYLILIMTTFSVCGVTVAGMEYAKGTPEVSVAVIEGFTQQFDFAPGCEFLEQEKLLEAWDDSEGHLREMLAQQLYAKVYLWTEHVTIVRKFGTNGVVFYDHINCRRGSTFVASRIFNQSDNLLARDLCVLLELTRQV